MLELEPIDNNGRRCIHCGHVRSLLDHHSVCECPVCHKSYDRTAGRSLAGHMPHARYTAQAVHRPGHRKNAQLQLSAGTRNLVLGLLLTLATLVTAIILRTL